MSYYRSTKPLSFLFPSSVSDRDQVSKASKWPLCHKGLLFFPGKVDSLPYLRHLNATLKHFLPCTHQVILLLLTGKTDEFQPTISSTRMLTSCCSDPDLVHDQLLHFSPFNPVEHHRDGPKIRVSSFQQVPTPPTFICLTLRAVSLRLFQTRVTRFLLLWFNLKPFSRCIRWPSSLCL